MIRKPNDYETAKIPDGNQAAQLAPGGHICRIQGAQMTKSRSGKDMLEIAFDIQEGGPFDGYYKARHERATNYDINARWPGVFRVTITNNDGQTNGFFKGLITAVEKSNPGYNFWATGGDEGTLKGKMVGFNFGEEEFLRTDRQTGEQIVAISVKPAYAVSVNIVKDGIEPQKLKKLPDGQRPAASAETFTEVDDPALPF